MNFHVSGKKVIVFGLGVTGRWAAAWLASLGASVRVADSRSRDQLDQESCEEMDRLGIPLETGPHGPDQVAGADLVVLSPGVSQDLPVLRHARESGIPVKGEMELASRFVTSPIIAVTGTNGKSTVTSLIGHILKEAGADVFVGGNLGMPLSALAASGAEPDWAVVEVSSFQLDTAETFQPEISVILNITPDHLDRYLDFEAYARAKMKIFARQSAGQFLVLNDDDPVAAGAAPPEGVAVIRYGIEEAPHRQAFKDGGKVKLRSPAGGECAYVSIGASVLRGLRNAENIMASGLVARLLGVETGIVQRAVDRFKGLPHRMELVARHEGVAFYNDSKATNVAAAAGSVSGIESPLILIAGGVHKGASYGPLVDAARGSVKFAVFMGPASDMLAGAFEGVAPFELAADMTEAVAKAAARAVPGDAVLLAPACSSFDMFTDYCHRGRVFTEAVKRLVDG